MRISFATLTIKILAYDGAIAFVQVKHTAVEITWSKFFMAVEILSEYPQLEEVVDEMKKEGEF